jgi:hypothetical protein
MRRKQVDINRQKMSFDAKLSFDDNGVTKRINYIFELCNLDDGYTNSLKLSILDSETNIYTFWGEAGDVAADNADTILALDRNNLVFKDFAQDLSGITWRSYGVGFNLKFDGSLEVAILDPVCIPSLQIKDAATVYIQGPHFKDLDIMAHDLIFKAGVLKAETAKVNVVLCTNSGNLQLAKSANIKTGVFKNNNSAVYAGQTLTLQTHFLDNEGGELSGVVATHIMVGTNWYANETSRIGTANSSTTIDFGTEFKTCAKLGCIVGSQVVLSNPNAAGVGVIAASQELVLRERVALPQAEIQTPLLTLQTVDFILQEQAHCTHTRLQLQANNAVVLKHLYRTSGSFEFCEAGIDSSNIVTTMLASDGPVADYNLETLPLAKYEISIQTTIDADKGIKFLTPSAHIVAGNSEQNNCARLFAKGGELKIYAVSFDSQLTEVSALKATVWAPRGVTNGRLISDHSRKALATFYSHINCPSSHRLGQFIRPISFMFLGENQADSIYDKRHLLTMPIAVSNGSIWNIKETTDIIGALNNYGSLETNKLKVHSVGPSVTEAGSIIVHEGCEFFNDHFIFKRLTTKLDFWYITNSDRGPVFNKASYEFCNSDAAELIAGKLSGNATIDVTASVFDVHTKDADVQSNFSNFKSSLYQKFISGTPTELLELQNANRPTRMNKNVFCSYEIKVKDITYPNNSYMPTEDTKSYAVGFLAKTNNFIGAEQVFAAKIVSLRDMVLRVTDGALNGMFAAPRIVIPVSGKAKILDSHTPFFIEPISSIRTLTEYKFNPHAVVMEETAPEPGISFNLRERFWFESEEAQNFYSQILEHVVVVDANNNLRNPAADTQFRFSPKLLLKIVRHDCQNVLHRAHIYNGVAMDLTFIQQLHRNTSEYLQQHNLTGTEFSTAIVSAADHHGQLTPPTKPLLFYKSRMNEQGLEVLFPVTYIPSSLIDEVRASNGGLLLSEVLIIIPENITPAEILSLQAIVDKPDVHTQISNIFEDNPTIAKQIHDRATELQQVEQQDLVVARDLPASCVIVDSVVRAKTVIVTLVKDRLEVTADIFAKDILLASLLNDVELRSVVVRRCVNTPDNFQDVVIQAKAHATNDLQIISGRNVVFNGFQTESGALTHIQAANILDMPLELVSQKIEYFNQKRKRGFVSDIHAGQHPSQHKSAVVSMISQWNVILAAPEIEAPLARLSAIEGVVEFPEVYERHVHTSNITSQKSTIFGRKTTTTSVQSYRESSRGAVFKVQKLEIDAKNRIALQNIISTAAINVLSAKEGAVAILLGRNSYDYQFFFSSNGPLWNKMISEVTQQRTYRPSVFSGTVEIDAKHVTIEQVRSQVLSFIERATLNQGDITLQTLEQYHHTQTEEAEGPGGVLAGIIAVAATVLTQGVASGLAGSLVGGAATTTVSTAGVTTVVTAASTANIMVSAGFSSLFAQSAVGLVQNKGDILATVEDLMQGSTIKGIITSMANAGITSAAMDTLKIPQLTNAQDFNDTVSFHIAHAAVRASLNVTLNGQSIERAIAGSVVEASLNIAAESAIHGRDLSAAQEDATRIAAGTTASVVNGENLGASLITSIASSVAQAAYNKYFKPVVEVKDESHTPTSNYLQKRNSGGFSSGNEYESTQSKKSKLSEHEFDVAETARSYFEVLKHQTKCENLEEIVASGKLKLSKTVDHEGREQRAGVYLQLTTDRHENRDSLRFSERYGNCELFFDHKILNSTDRYHITDLQQCGAFGPDEMRTGAMSAWPYDQINFIEVLRRISIQEKGWRQNNEVVFYDEVDLSQLKEVYINANYSDRKNLEKRLKDRGIPVYGRDATNLATENMLKKVGKTPTDYSALGLSAVAAAPNTVNRFDGKSKLDHLPLLKKNANTKPAGDNALRLLTLNAYHENNDQRNLIRESITEFMSNPHNAVFFNSKKPFTFSVSLDFVVGRFVGSVENVVERLASGLHESGRLAMFMNTGIFPYNEQELQQMSSSVTGLFKRICREGVMPLLNERAQRRDESRNEALDYYHRTGDAFGSGRMSAQPDVEATSDVLGLVGIAVALTKATPILYSYSKAASTKRLGSNDIALELSRQRGTRMIDSTRPSTNLTAVEADRSFYQFNLAFKRSTNTFHPNSIGAGRKWGSIYERLDELKLPHNVGEVRFTPSKHSIKMKEIDIVNGYGRKGIKDVYDNIWYKGSSKSTRFGEEWEWDVWLSSKGRAMYEELYKEKFPHKRFSEVAHLNVSLKGKLTH